MRLIRKEQIVTTIFDKVLEDEDTIRTVFTNLHSHSVDFSITIKKNLSYQEESFNISYEKVIITQLNDNDTFNMIVVKKGIKTTMKNINFSDVVEINAMTRKHNILDVDDALTRWEILDYS